MGKHFVSIRKLTASAGEDAGMQECLRIVSETEGQHIRLFTTVWISTAYQPIIPRLG